MWVKHQTPLDKLFVQQAKFVSPRNLRVAVAILAGCLLLIDLTTRFIRYIP